jgi:seryl-tRNA synthetase
MLDINLLRAEKGGNPDLVRESQRRRYAKDTNMVDEVIAIDVEWRQAQFQVCPRKAKMFRRQSRTSMHNNPLLFS